MTFVCILSVCTLLKVVGYYDLSVLSMSVMVFQKNKFGWGGWVETYAIFFFFFEFFLTLQGPLHTSCALDKPRVFPFLRRPGCGPTDCPSE